MLYRRILLGVMIVVGLFLVGCGGGSDEEKTPAVKEDSAPQVSLHGTKTTLTLPLPFEFKNPPLDERGTLPPEVQGIILKAERYQAGDNGVFLNVSYSTFSDQVRFDNLSEPEIYNALNEELKLNVTELENNQQFSNLQITPTQTKVDGNPALIAMATYGYQGKDYQSTLVYTLHGQDFWRLIFDYQATDAQAVSTVDNAVKGIKIR